MIGCQFLGMTGESILKTRRARIEVGLSHRQRGSSGWTRQTGPSSDSHRGSDFFARLKSREDARVFKRRVEKITTKFTALSSR